jgi:hypothetical protein
MKSVFYVITEYVSSKWEHVQWLKSEHILFYN